ncbi:MAG: hypothetical protein CMO26_02110 [Thiotrichales bacterium]|nr:hypothetical protein [Thiotrichales bacterium]|tara:strand:- start:54 stop:779 length:726 start_codon:yes stop_codon:yes gene_type:complete
MTGATEQHARRQLAAAHRLTVMENFHEGTWNHFSLKHPDNPELIFLTPGHVHWKQVNASNLVLMGPQKNMVSGELEPNVAAWIIHYPIQRARPDLKCLMHVHTPYATALSMRADLRFNTRASQAAGHFHGSVAYFDTYDGSTEEEEGIRMAEALGDNKLLVLRNHGYLVGGETVGLAWHNLYMFERACMFQMLAEGNDNNLSLIDEHAAAELEEYSRASIWDTRFDNLCALLDDKEPDYLN